MDSTERRLFYRFPAQLPFALEFIENNRKLDQLRTKNISGCGILFSCAKPVPMGCLVRIQLALPIGSTIELYGKVVRIEELRANLEYNVGVVFLNVSDTDINSIELSCRICLDVED